MTFFGKNWSIQSQIIISWHLSGRRLLCFYHPVTACQLLSVTVVESTIFIMSLVDAVVEHVLMQVGSSQVHVNYFRHGTKIVG